MTLPWWLCWSAALWAQAVATPPSTGEPALLLVDIEDGASVPVLVVRPAAAGVVVASCRGVSWERFDLAANAFVALEAPPCDADGPALVPSADGLRVPLEGDAPPGSVVRAVVVVGRGCAAGRPLPVAGCDTISTVSSASHTVLAGR